MTPAHVTPDTKELDWPGAIWTVVLYLLAFAGVACLAYAMFLWLHLV